MTPPEHAKGGGMVWKLSIKIFSKNVLLLFTQAVGDFSA